MLKNYLKTAWRNLQKNKVTSIINILGLAIGIGASLLRKLQKLKQLIMTGTNKTSLSMTELWLWQQ